MDNIYIDSKKDLDLLNELLDSYSLRLEELVANYLNYKKTVITLLASASLFLLIFVYLYVLTGMVSSTKYVNLFYGAPIILTIYASLIYTFIGRRKHENMRDEAFLICKKLEQLIKITSQTREHVIPVSNLELFVFDLKLIEAEEVLLRAKKIFNL
ncbi:MULTISPECIES: hypothetical protein [unclassified Psychrobacter]|uniref:hypothetical protein n=1 Tax=unclassified Psychrobacter TaxID=196806 RepID=UPI003FD1E581